LIKKKLLGKYIEKYPGRIMKWCPKKS
jgi:hypothetical protein